MTTQEKNKLLAKFMSTSLFDGELLPVWYKFRDLREEMLQSEHFAGYGNREIFVILAFQKGTFADLYDALVSAVQWYNSIKKEA